MPMRSLIISPLKYFLTLPIYLLVPLLLAGYSLVSVYFFILESTSLRYTVVPVFSFVPSLLTFTFASLLVLSLFKKLCFSPKSFQSDSFFFLLLTATLFLVHPRSFTYDTGLYHAPFVQHLSSLGLEWNLGWLHTRYAYFNIFLYGQALLSKSFQGTHLLPSFNSLLLTSTLTYFYSLLRKTPNNLLLPLILTGGMLLIPSESSESFHSYNSDFSLALFLVFLALYLLYDFHRLSELPVVLTLFFLLPLIKLSGLTQSLLLLPLFAYTLYSRRISPTLSLPFLLLILIYAFPVLVTSYVMTGYLAYPLPWTGPFRPESIPVQNVIQEVKSSTIAWARFAYSNQLHKLTADAPLASWFPGWIVSLNGRRMIGFSLLSYLSLVPKKIVRLNSFLSKKELFIVLPLCIYWIFAIFVFPPDPRFFLGPILLSIFFFVKSFNLTLPYPTLSHAMFASCIFSFITFTAIWRTSDFTGLGHPNVIVVPSDNTKFAPYVPSNPALPINTPTNSDVCWTAPSPCR